MLKQTITRVPGDKDKANFNEDYMMVKALRKTNECRYYLLKEKSGNKKKVNLKMWREDWLVDNWEGIKMIDNEVLLMKELNHPNIVEMLDFDNQGFIEEPTGERIENVCYMLLEHCPARLDHFCQKSGPLGENDAVFLMK
jgi:serine/threonine protein kinase